MSSRISGNSFIFENVYIQSVGTTAGIVEHQGPLGHYFDKHYPDHYHHQGRDRDVERCYFALFKKRKSQKRRH